MIFLWRRRAVTPRLTRAMIHSPQRYGSMRAVRTACSTRTWFLCRRLRLRLVAFLVRMWLRLAWPHLYLPEAVFRKRLAAARWVSILVLAIGRSFRFFNYWPRRWLAPLFPSCLCRLVSH